MPPKPSHRTYFRAVPAALLRAPARGRLREPARTSAGGPPDSRSACEEVLRDAAADAPFMEALHVASASLARLVESSTEPGRLASRTDAQLRKAAVSVVRYEARMRSRSTPFGLFAGVAPVRIGTSAKVSWPEPPTSRTRVDLDWLSRLIRELEQDSDLLPHLTVHAHTGVVPRGGRLVMATPSNPGTGAGDAARSEVSVRVTPVVTAALELASDGILAGAAIASLERRFPTAPAGAVAGLLATLVRQEFLITGLRPVLDGSDPLNRLIRVLAAASESAGAPLPVLTALRDAAAARDRFDAAAPGSRRTALAELEAGLRRLGARDGDRLVHVDLALGADVRLPQAVADEAARSMDVLWRLSPQGPGMPALRPYHLEFVERYGTDRVVPLLEVLDDTVGLGAPPGYEWPASSRAEEPHAPSDRARDLLLGRLAAAAVRDGAREVVLDEALVDRLAPGEPDLARLPRSCELFCTLVAESEEALDRGDFLLVTGPGPGPAEAGATFGRFAGIAGGVTEELADAVHRDVPGAAHLTVAFQPRTTRALNIANSPRAAEHQVAIGLPPDPAASAVRLDEIGVAGNTEHLYAVHLPTGRRLLPHTSHALDLRGQAPNAARFLLELGRDATRMCTPWDWGPVKSGPFLPRVRYGRTVLFPATWRLDELREHTSGEPAAWSRAVAGWRARWRVPERIVLSRLDHRLHLDLSDDWHLEVLRDAIAKDPDLFVLEVPGGEGRPDGWLRAPDGAPRAAELALAFTGAEGPAGRLRAAPPPTAGPRAAEVGGEWLYAKLYLPGRHTAAFLCERLTPFLAGLPTECRELVDRWFFIRYRDQEDHLRLRFHGPAGPLWERLLPALRAAVLEWTAEGLVGRCVLDAYEPEWERYGGPDAQEAAERFFAADSRAALALLRAARSQGADGPRWDQEALAAMSMASIAQAFGPPPAPEDAAVGDVDAHHRRAGAAPARYGPEEPGAAWLSGGEAGRELPDGFRADRARWLALIDPAGGWPALAQSPAGREVLAALTDQATELRAYRELLDRLAGTGESWSPLPRVAAGLLHMTCNRLLGPDRDAEKRAYAIARACVTGNADRRRHQR
ncbi:lantibiotic dehydratase [Streptomyces sp. ISL-43]|uniref:lantibiotic dehydratase n=1 Tax=Streptomyces sp. ISL-43 TaxID=2819183 RepID=UPI001BEC371D|nr:lantibiotic dehydratase [Streptomyces sp. ISL-43]MBT2448818.1 lantibiotic dehydratase [Streptomyces sp. ISL-43]